MDDPSDRGYSRAPELEDLLSLCAALKREAVRYVLIGGFAVILHGFVRGTKDIDLLVDASDENVRALKRALSTLPDNAIAAIADNEVRQYQVVRIADEVVVDLMQAACGIDYPAALRVGWCSYLSRSLCPSALRAHAKAPPRCLSDRTRKRCCRD